MLGIWREQHLPQIVASLANRTGHEAVGTLLSNILRSSATAPSVNLADQKQLLALFRAEEIGLTLSSSTPNNPPAIVLHHPPAKYFSV